MQLLRAEYYLKVAITLIEKYNGSLPLQHYLKSFFSANKKFGSKDRKFITHLCYSYYRVGVATEKSAIKERIIQSLFLQEDKEQHWHELLAGFTKQEINTSKIFPFADELSEEIDHNFFSASHIQQPYLYLRIRPGFVEKILRILSNQSIEYLFDGNFCLQLANGFKAENYFSINKEVIVQDASSQKIGQLLEIVAKEIKTKNISIWDCCAASGGKSILAKDIMPNAALTVSDIRSSILANLDQRFAEAGINKYNAFVADLSEKYNGNEEYDCIIADVPCSGSGTWSRTPEQLLVFEKKQIEYYQKLQQKIVENALPTLKGGGYLLYITCSAFAAENEKNVEWMQEILQLKLIKSMVIKGYESSADTMFAALLQTS